MDAVIVTGPPGAGKSSVAAALHDALGDDGIANALIEVDELERAHPPLPRERALHHAALLARGFREAGHDLLLVTATVEDAAYLAALRAATGADRVTAVRLEAPPDVLEARIRAREPAGWSGLERLVGAARELAGVIPGIPGLETAFATGDETREAVAARLRAVLAARGVPVG